MGSQSSSALNTKGFSDKLEQINVYQIRKQLPVDHLTYEGAFNEIEFKIGKRASEPLEIAHGFVRNRFANSIIDNRPCYYLPIFLKGNKDGQQRDQILNSVVILDISGSMGDSLCREQFSFWKRSRLDLAKRAIMFFVGKLAQDDSFGLVIFNNQARTVIPCTRVSNLNMPDVLIKIEDIKFGGGTTLESGFKQGLNTLKAYLRQNPGRVCQNRMIMLTDVDNNGPRKDFIQNVVTTTGIHTTIVRISSEFKSDLCELLTNVRGFNYFCATQDQDLNKYMSHNFDWTFFPSVYDVELQMETNDVQSFQVFGAPDKKGYEHYNDFTKYNSRFTVAKISTLFPSQLKENQQSQTLTNGGLILIKLKFKSQDIKKFKAKINLTYTDSKKQRRQGGYNIQTLIPQAENYYSDQAMEQAIQGFHFVHELRQIITCLPTSKFDIHKHQYLNALQHLEQIAPEQKILEVRRLKDLLKEHINMTGFQNRNRTR